VNVNPNLVEYWNYFFYVYYYYSYLNRIDHGATPVDAAAAAQKMAPVYAYEQLKHVFTKHEMQQLAAQAQAAMAAAAAQAAAAQAMGAAVPPLPLLTQTTLTMPVLKGAISLAIENPTGFTVGQTIVIEEGTPRREVNTITGFGSITLEIPCKFDHPAGASITAEAEVVPQGLMPSSILSPAPAPAPSDDDSDRPPSIEGVPGVCKEEVEELKEKLDKALKNTLLTSMHSLLHRNGFSVDNHDVVAMEDFHAVLLQSSTSANSTAWDKPLAAARSAICSPPALGGTAVMGRPSALRGNSPRARSALRFVKNHFL
jgi:hypothetical protein